MWGCSHGGTRQPAGIGTISAILEAHPDGSLHLPVPPELRAGKIRVEATLEAVTAPPANEEERRARLREAMRRIRERDPFRSIADPVAWQRAMREDVTLPERD
jgi:hypothetical protein